MRFSPSIAGQPEPGLALVAGETGIAEIAAARALQQVAADGAHVAHLRRGRCQQRLRQITGQRARTSGCAATSLMRAIASRRRPSPLDLDARQPDAVQIDELRRRLDIVLHQLHQVRAAGDDTWRPAPGAAAIAASSDVGWTRVKCLHGSALPRGVADRRDDVGIGAAAADIAAHPLADFGIGAGVALLDQRRGRT